jgi:hypothetical protein
MGLLEPAPSAFLRKTLCRVEKCAVTLHVSRMLASCHEVASKGNSLGSLPLEAAHIPLKESNWLLVRTYCLCIGSRTGRPWRRHVIECGLLASVFQFGLLACSCCRLSFRQYLFRQCALAASSLRF